jgi:HK97 family phage prohead protease
MAEPSEMTRDLPPLSLRAAFSPSSVDVEKRTVEMTWTTGARVLRGFWERYYEELSLEPKHVRMGRLNNGAPLLAAHNGSEIGAVLGVVESARLEGKKGTAVVRFAKPEDDPEAEKVFRKVKDGILQNVSVGYRVHKLEKLEESDDKVPVYRAIDWEPYEISVVPMGADDGAGFRSGGAQTPNPCVIVTRQEQSMDPKDPKNPTPPAPVMEPASVEATVRAAALARVDEAKRTAANQAAAVEEAKASERGRVAEIRRLVRRTKLGDALADKFIEDGTTVDAVRAAVLDHLAAEDEAVPTSQHTRFEALDDAREKFQRGAAAWLIQKAGVVGAIRDAQRLRPDSAAFQNLTFDPGEFRGMSLLDLARESLERSGVKTRSFDKMRLVEAALSQRGAHGFNSTSDFANILENVLHKTLLAAYAITPDTWEKFCYRGSVTDFRPHPRYRLGSFGRLDAVNEHGEFKSKSIPDAEKQSISATTKGNVIALSRQSIVNDDMSAFSRLATQLGRGAKLSIEMDVYAALALNAGMGPALSDGNALFHATHNNINGTAAGVTVVGLAADRVVMASQKDPSANEILDLRPHCLVVPVAQEFDAKVLNEAQYDPDTANKLQKPNACRGLFTYVVGTPRISGTRRYVFADPNVAPVLEVAFLDGQSEPFLDVMNGWRVDGVEYKVRLDYGVAPIDFRGAVTNAGV